MTWHVQREAVYKALINRLPLCRVDIVPKVCFSLAQTNTSLCLFLRSHPSTCPRRRLPIQ